MNASLAIAPLRADEVEDAIALWDEATLLRPWNDPRGDIAFARGQATSDVLAGRTDGRLIATAMVGHDGHRGWIYYLAVAAEFRGRGIGRAMMDACETWCRERGVPKLQLMVRGDNAGARGFYERIGFVRGGVVVLAKVL